MKPTKLTSNVMYGDEFFTVDFDPNCNVTLLQGGTGHGKGAIRAALQLTLQGAAYIDRQKSTYSSGSALLGYLNPGYSVQAKLEHSKGVSEANIIPRKNGSVPRDFHKGWKDPYGADIAQTMRDIMAATPDTMAKKLVAMIVKGVTKQEIIKDLDDGTTEWLNSYFSRKSLSVVEALEKALEDAESNRKNANAAWKDLVSRKDEFAAEVREQEMTSAQEDLTFWAGQETLVTTWEAQQQRDDTVVEGLKERIHKHEDEVARLRHHMSEIKMPDQSKVAVYEAAAKLADYAHAAGLTSCPYCHSSDSVSKTSHATTAAQFRGWAHQLENDPAFRKMQEYQDLLKAELAEIDALRRQIKLIGVTVTTSSKPRYAREVVAANKQDAENVITELRNRQRRWEDEVLRKKKEAREHANLELWKARCKDLKKVKGNLVDSRIGEFIERTRYFMPDPKAVAGGVLHIDIKSRQLGFMRNGRLHLATSGSETEMIAVAMALAAGSSQPSKPVIFLGDVGWGVEALEACLNEWVKYKGHVIAQTTAKVRASQLNSKVQVIKPADITMHAKKVFEPVVVTPSINFVERPEDYETSTFRFAAMACKAGDKVIIEVRNRSKTVVTQTYEAEVTAVNAHNISVKTASNFAATIKIATGKTPFTENIWLKGLDEALVTATYHKRLHTRLGYPESFKPGYATAKSIWDNMVHADDAEARQDLIT